MMRLGTFALALLVASPSLHAAIPDPRVRLLPYEPDQVVNLSVDAGYAAVIELGEDEAIQNVVIGDSSTWQVTANSSSDRIIVKPIANAVPTNMIVITDARRYVFLLQSGGGAGSLFVLRFTYPAQPAGASAPMLAAATYRFSGERTLFPKAMRDDGKHTTITWAEQTSLPAVFAIHDGGKEAIVNGRMVGNDYVIEGTAGKYVFRAGDAHVIATRRIAKAPRR